MWLEAWKNNPNQLWSINWSNGIEKMVGLFLGNGDFIHINWDTVYKKFDKVITAWENRSLSMKKKAVVANTLALSKLMYIGSVTPLPKQYCQLFNTLLFNFTWGNKPEEVACNVLFNKCIDGGLSLMHIRIKLQALQVMHLKQFIYGVEAKWQHFARYLIGIYLHKYNISFDLNQGPHASPDWIPHFYREALDALVELFKV